MSADAQIKLAEAWKRYKEARKTMAYTYSSLDRAREAYSFAQNEFHVAERDLHEVVAQTVKENK